MAVILVISTTVNACDLALTLTVQWIGRPLVLLGQRILGKIIWRVFALWLVVMTVVGMQCYVTSKTLDKTKQLATQIDELHKVFSFDLTHRLKYTEQIAQKIDRIDPTLNQLRIASGNNLFAPDITQLIYLTERFLEDTAVF